jgi:F420H(2)-dependent quinone reductase
MTDDYNTQIIEEFRANDGRVGGPWEGTPLILVHHIGAKSGIEHVTPLGSFPHGDGRYLIASVAGTVSRSDQRKLCTKYCLNDRLNCVEGRTQGPLDVEPLGHESR